MKCVKCAPGLQDVIIVTLFAFVVYAFVDVYTNLFWQSLGRAPRSWAPSRVAPGRWLNLPLMPVLLIWVPTFFAPALLLFMSDLAPHEFVSSWYGVALLLVAVGNSAACAVEIAFAAECVRDAEPGSPFALPLHEAFFGHDRRADSHP